MPKNDPVRDGILEMLGGGHAHIGIDDAVKDFPEKLRGTVPNGAEHSVWELLEHMRIAQWDILEFSRNSKHVSPKFPDGYWPESKTPSDAEWKKCLGALKKDLKAMEDLVSDPKTDLYEKIPHGTGQNILAEALLVADHNAYHIGQLVLVRKLLGAWV